MCPLTHTYVNKNKRVCLFLLLVLSTIASSCATPEQRYKTLSFFFDGVPSPESNQPEELEPVSAELKELQLSMHPPFAQRKCQLCHASGYSNALRLPKSELCASCHSSDQVAGKFLHGPAGSGQCYACHDPHRSKLPNLLLSEGSSLCAQCHQEENYPGIDTHRVEKGDSCLECHNPHGADNPNFLRDENII